MLAIMNRTTICFIGPSPKGSLITSAENCLQQHPRHRNNCPCQTDQETDQPGNQRNYSSCQSSSNGPNSHEECRCHNRPSRPSYAASRHSSAASAPAIRRNNVTLAVWRVGKFPRRSKIRKSPVGSRVSIASFQPLCLGSNPMVPMMVSATSANHSTSSPTAISGTAFAGSSWWKACLPMLLMTTTLTFPPAVVQILSPSRLTATLGGLLSDPDNLSLYAEKANGSRNVVIAIPRDPIGNSCTPLVRLLPCRPLARGVKRSTIGRNHACIQQHRPSVGNPT